ncbi:MAG TPA: ABC transporter permease [Chloroflexi bacterium]|nr:ABC transporter permease [Chloroflexota bacterium]
MSDTEHANAEGRVAIRHVTLADFLRENIIWVVLLIAVVATSIVSPVFLDSRNILNILRQGALLGIVAIGMTFALIGGAFDLSVGATMGLATVIVIKANPATLGSSMGVVVLALLAGLLVGVVNGILVGRFHTNSVVTTIGIRFVVWGVTLIYTRAQHVWAPDMFEPLKALGTGNLWSIPIPVFVFLAVAALGHLVFSRTTFGRYLYATGGNSTAARLSGINTERIQLISYVLSGLGAAIAGVVIAARVQDVDPSFGIGREFDALTAVVLGGTSLFGGRGSASGTVAGVLLLGVLANAMTLLGISIHYQLMIKGLIVIVAVAADVLFRRKKD